MKRFKFAGTGGEFFVQFLIGMLLTMITFGIYMPWFMVRIFTFTASKTTIEGTSKGPLHLEFEGTGGRLFVVGLVGYLLTVITLGIYGAWFLANLIRFFADNTTARDSDGATYRLQFTASGGELFVTFLLGFLLTTITFGLYAPWFICSILRLLAGKTEILRGDERVGEVQFSGTGGDLFVTFLVGCLLTMLTLGIYGFWFSVKLWQFELQNTTVTVDDQSVRGDFVGTGGQLLGICLLGYLLSMITLGIYGAWYYVNLTRYQLENTQFSDSPATA